jgi:TetR/AcrR family transcriptional regulator, ethionamide resistance regulator
MATTQHSRRRRRPEEAEREILDTAEELLRERPFRELTVDDLMSRTTLSRPAFYVYFKDRHQLVMRLVERLGADLMERADSWLKGSGDPAEDGRAAIEGVAGVYAEHGRVLRAIADAATNDPRVERAYGALIERFVEATRVRIEEDVEAGRISGVDPGPTAEALIWMNERYLTASFGGARDPDPREVSETLLRIWLRALYRLDY